MRAPRGKAARAAAPVPVATRQRKSGTRRSAPTPAADTSHRPARPHDAPFTPNATSTPRAGPEHPAAPPGLAALGDATKLWEQWMASLGALGKMTPFALPTSPGMPAAPGAAAAGMPAFELPQVGLAADELLHIQQTYVTRLTELWQNFLQHPEALAQPIRDSRFSDPAWQKNTLAAFTARAYLLNAETMNAMADAVQADRKLKQRLKFAVQQWVDAASPSNFLALNPKAQQRLVETKGESLKTGLDNLLADMERGKISQSDEAAFEVGRNVATSQGMVVFENALMQLIQYQPLTARVRARPFLIVPPSINKFYILDLQPENSFVRYAVEQGNTVFLVSWKNPHEPESTMTWDDYLELGPIAALHAVQKITGSRDVNALGFCVGGTILASALAVMFARGERPVASLTLMTALLDFADTGILDIFVDEQTVRFREQSLGKGGLMAGADLAKTFSSLRANDLIWNYVINNYLEGKQPPAFDLLYWNGDSTNLPGPMYVWYLRNTYLENNLKVPGKVACCGVPVDLTRIDVPIYVFAAREDHIVPWPAAYASARVFGPRPPGSVRYVLGASGHIAGSINPASKNKRSYWTGGSDALPAAPEQWLAQAHEQPGSWWTDWNRWLGAFAGGEVAAPKKFGGHGYAPIEPAPGRYVKEKA
jgi:polyhydroxyalkanoate synthase